MFMALCVFVVKPSLLQDFMRCWGQNRSETRADRFTSESQSANVSPATCAADFG